MKASESSRFPENSFGGFPFIPPLLPAASGAVVVGAAWVYWIVGGASVTFDGPAATVDCSMPISLKMVFAASVAGYTAIALLLG